MSRSDDPTTRRADSDPLSERTRTRATAPDDTLPADTLPDLGGDEARTGPESGLQFGRFRLDRLLGQGGMGRVYEAWDPHLRRTVAVKVLRGADPVSVRRFVREARIQAGVAHPGICPVFETGDIDGTPYIVMQRLHARPLDEAAADLPLEQKLVLVRQVAEAVHAAHRTGLIHRDLKPANILVEAAEEGPPRPWVVDFGLARAADADGLTRAGDVVGTPAYMAPEQVMGDDEHLDRRADVYSLGATLYRLLAGDAPFAGPHAAAMVRALADEPEPLRPLGVPADVEAIVFKCLEKDPDARYGSARELAEDLDRYLDGEPVLARPTDGWYRLHKWLHRHRAPVAVGAVLGLLLLVALGWGAWTAWRADERETLARELTERVEEIEATARYSHLSPLHDVRPDRRLLRRRMDGIRAAMERAGALGRGPGEYALGRGHLALDELESAREHLERAWEDGYRTPEVASALGLTLSGLYREHLASIELGGDWEARKRRIETLEATYGHPARRFLEQRPSRDSHHEPSPDEVLLEALAHFHDERFAEALEILDSARGHRPWAYELWRLAGDVHRTWAGELDADGEDDEARAELDRARDAYRRAADIAESDPAVHRAAAQAIFLRLALEDPASDTITALFTEGLASLDRAHSALPDDPDNWLWTARFHRRSGQNSRARDEDPSGALAEAIEAAEHAARLAEEPSSAWSEVARAQWSWAQWLGNRGEDPSERLALASEAFHRVAPEHRDFGYWTSLGLAHATLADHRAGHGESAAAAESYRSAIDAYRAATGMHSSPFSASVNLGAALYKLAGLSGTEAPETLLREAVDVLERAEALEPEHVAPPYYLGLVHLRLALGGDPVYGRLDPEIAERARESFQRALAIAPDRFQVHSGLGEIHQQLGVLLDEQGEDPRPSFRKARDAYTRAFELAPDHPVPTFNLAWAAYLEGLAQFRAGRSPEASLAESLRLFEQLLETSRDPGTLLGRAKALLVRAHAELDSGARSGRVEATLAEAREALHELMTGKDGSPEVLRVLGRVETLAGENASRRGDDPEPAFALARQYLQRALEQTDAASPRLAAALLSLARARWLLDRGLDEEPPLREARVRQAGAEVERGLENIQRARALRPDHVEILQVEKELEELEVRAAARR